MKQETSNYYTSQGGLTRRDRLSSATGGAPILRVVSEASYNTSPIAKSSGRIRNGNWPITVSTLFSARKQS